MDTNSERRPKTAITRGLTQEEEIAINKLKQRGLVHSQPIFKASDVDGKETMELALEANLKKSEAMDLIYSKLLETTGSSNILYGFQLLETVRKSLLSVKGKESISQLNLVVDSMQALAPQDEYEGQLAAQLIILHDHAMDLLGRAKRTERVDFSNVYLNGASKLLRRHHETLDALLKYRRKGEQRVHVEHVHVYGGGQAIVGNVNAGGGMNQKSEKGPHAKV